MTYYLRMSFFCCTFAPAKLCKTNMPSVDVQNMILKIQEYLNEGVPCFSSGYRVECD